MHRYKQHRCNTSSSSITSNVLDDSATAGEPGTLVAPPPPSLPMPCDADGCDDSTRGDAASSSASSVGARSPTTNVTCVIDANAINQTHDVYTHAHNRHTYLAA